MYQLNPDQYDLVKPLFEPMNDHLAVRAILDRIMPGPVYVDHPAQPRSALTWVHSRYFLAGAPDNDTFNDDVRRLFADTIYPQNLAAGKAMFSLHYASAPGSPPVGWESQIDTILPGKFPLKGRRQYYACRALQQDWRALLPHDFSLRYVDAALLALKHLKNLEALEEEMCSERPTVQEFLANSFGVCLLCGDEIVGWCLSEYNCADRCEVGIETVASYRRRGLGTIMSLALVDLALSRGVTEIGWHCWANNTPSAATALKAGFEHALDYSVYWAWFDEIDNLAVHGNLLYWDHKYAEALVWYERAFAHGAAKGWAYWNATCAAAALEQTERACAYLERAVAAGFADLSRLQQADELKNLRASPRWSALIECLSTPR